MQVHKQKFSRAGGGVHGTRALGQTFCQKHNQDLSFHNQETFFLVARL